MTLFVYGLALSALVASSPLVGSAQESGPVKHHREEAEPAHTRSTQNADGKAQPPIPSIDDSPADRLKPERGNETRGPERQPDEWWRKLTTDPNATFAGAVAFFTLILVIIGYWQGRQLRDTVDVMRDSTRVARDTLNHARETARSALEESRRATVLSLRPWLVIQSFDLVELDRHSTPYEEGWFRIVIRNAGKLPAISVAATFEPTIIPKSDPTPGVYGNLGGDGVVIAAEEVRNVAFAITNLTPERIAAIRSGDLFLWITARLVYTDALGTAGETVQSGHYRKATDMEPESFISDRDGRSMT